MSKFMIYSLTVLGGFAIVSLIAILIMYLFGADIPKMFSWAWLTRDYGLCAMPTNMICRLH